MNKQYNSPIFATNFCLLTLLVNIGKIKVLNQDQNTSKNVNITLCNILNWGNWNSGFVKLGVRWAERDNTLFSFSFQSKVRERNADIDDKTVPLLLKMASHKIVHDSLNRLSLKRFLSQWDEYLFEFFFIFFWPY